MRNAVKVKLDNGFIGYVIGSEFFITGSEVVCFERVPAGLRDSLSVKRSAGVVVEFLED